MRGLLYSTKLWREKILAELELQENWLRKLWQLVEAKPIQYLISRDLTTFWQIKFGGLAMNLPNPPKFSPAKVFFYTVYCKHTYINFYTINYKMFIKYTQLQQLTVTTTRRKTSQVSFEFSGQVNPFWVN